MTQPLSRAEHRQLKSQKKAQPYLGTAAASLGLGAAGAQFGGAALHRVGYKPKTDLQGMYTAWTPRAGKGVKAMKVANAGSRIKLSAIPLAIASGAVGGASGLNAASISRKQNRREGIEPITVKKSYLVPVSKAWTREKMKNRKFRDEHRSRYEIGEDTPEILAGIKMRHEEKVGKALLIEDLAELAAANRIGNYGYSKKRNLSPRDNY